MKPIFIVEARSSDGTWINLLTCSEYPVAVRAFKRFTDAGGSVFLRFTMTTKG